MLARNINRTAEQKTFRGRLRAILLIPPDPYQARGNMAPVRKRLLTNLNVHKTRLLPVHAQQ